MIVTVVAVIVSVVVADAVIVAVTEAVAGITTVLVVVAAGDVIKQLQAELIRLAGTVAR